MFKQTVSAFAMVLAWNAAAAAQTAAAPACAMPEEAVQVDLKPVPGSDLVTVPVEINDTTKQFLLALSTDPTAISQAAVNDLHLAERLRNSDNTQFMQNLGATNGGNAGTVSSLGAPVFDARNGQNSATMRPRVMASSFALGDASGKNFQLVIADDKDLGKSEPYDGLMTGNFLKQYDVDLDFGGQKLRYLTATSCTDPGQVVFWRHSAVAVIPMTTTVDGKMQIPVTIAGQSIPAVIDTGSARTVMRRDVAESMFGLKSDTPDMMPEGDLRDGSGQQVYHHTFPQISFAGVIAGNVPALIESNSMVHTFRTNLLYSRAQFAGEKRIPSLTLGMDVLHQLHLYIATGQQTLYATAAK